MFLQTGQEFSLYPGLLRADTCYPPLSGPKESSLIMARFEIIVEKTYRDSIVISTDIYPHGVVSKFRRLKVYHYIPSTHRNTFLLALLQSSLNTEMRAHTQTRFLPVTVSQQYFPC